MKGINHDPMNDVHIYSWGFSRVSEEEFELRENSMEKIDLQIKIWRADYLGKSIFPFVRPDIYFRTLWSITLAILSTIFFSPNFNRSVQHIHPTLGKYMIAHNATYIYVSIYKMRYYWVHSVTYRDVRRGMTPLDGPNNFLYK